MCEGLEVREYGLFRELSEGVCFVFFVCVCSCTYSFCK